MILVGIFLIVLAGSFLLQSFGVGGERLFEFVWPVLVALIGFGFIGEARKKKQCAICEHAHHADKKTTQKDSERPATSHHVGKGAGFTKSV